MKAFTKHLRQETSIAFFTFFVIGISILIPCKNLDATHAAGADLRYECLGNGEYRFTLNFYRDCDSVSAPTHADIPISSSCFSNTLTLPKDTIYQISQVCSNVTTSCRGGNYQGFENHVYSGSIILDTTCSDYSATFKEHNRNSPVDNLDFSGGNPELFIDVSLDPTVCNSSPFLSANPIPYICTGSQISYNLGAVDPENDSLSYSLVTPLKGSGNAIIPYVSPYTPTYPLATQSGSFPFNNNKGQMTFTPTTAQTAVVAVQVEEYRNGQLIGSIKRDMQFQIINCSSNQPTVVDTLLNLQGGHFTSNNRIEMCPGDSLSFDIKAFDEDLGQSITMTSNADVAIPDASFDTTGSGTDTITGSFSWVPQGIDTSANVFKVTVRDDGCPIFTSQTIAYNIFVLEGTSANPKDEAYCPVGGPIDINVVGGNQFSWKPDSGIVNASSDSSTIQVAPNTPTRYFVESGLTSTCAKRDTVFVDRAPNFMKTVEPSPADTICEGQNTQFDVLINPSDTMWAPYSYDWSPTSSLNNASIKNPVASPVEDTKYYVDITSDTGCTIRDSVSVFVKGQVPDVTITGNNVLCKGDSNQLKVEACTGNALFDDFDSSIDSSMWSNIGSVMANGNCGANSGNNALWFGNSSGTRQIATVGLNTMGGGALDFYLKEGDVGAACESPNGSDEYMKLEYSNNGGITWITLNTYNAGNNQYTSFTLIQEPIPAAAQTSSTRFRFRQNDYDSKNDHWAIDDVSYQCCGSQCGNYTYNWSPGRGISDRTVRNPLVFPDSSTSYVVEVTLQGTNCTKYDTIDITVEPDFNYTTGPEDTICKFANTDLLVAFRIPMQ